MVLSAGPYPLSHSLVATSGPHHGNHCSSPGKEQTWAGLVFLSLCQDPLRKFVLPGFFLKHTKMQSLRRWAFIAGFCAKSSVIFAFPFPAEFPACSQPVTQRPGDVLFWEVEETPRVSLRKHDGEENAHC